jgi:hypothetical protein
LIPALIRDALGLLERAGLPPIDAGDFRVRQAACGVNLALFARVKQMTITL